ncbi:MAG: FKBP-type peptidyl-prolyl cis-trans isomerase [Saprospiraceae bacterium]|nr:FKBP-type peptidyl-prolyl cis-trans isomerase [Saprospiraceae bacterium]MBK8669163.1 FKBP-type peptidyl-prolyl cis-trans isomerase [Saprospiraceae bacterium]MBL0100890.1 FKBP-type peptidyl-prolyl cis-trans isomerase [Saprospiraceae bacterium]
MKFSFFSIMAACTLLIVSCKPTETKTPSGYDYTVVTAGSGDAPKTADYVLFTIKIMGEDGKVLQEMKEGPQMPVLQIPADFPKGKEANPVVELLAKSKVGGVYKLMMPVDSIPNAPVDIQAMKHIVYEIAVKQIKSEEEYKKYMEEQQAEAQAKIAANMEKIPAIEELAKTTLADYKAGKLETKTTASGLKYYVVKQGEGPNAANGNKVMVNYYGTLTDGTMFDNSFQRGQALPFTIGVGEVIKGWDEGVALLNKGSKAFLFVPADLGYGAAGSPPVIPANAELMFYVELEDIAGH